MTPEKLDWILNMASDFIMIAKANDGHEIYNLTAFASPLNYKIPIRFIFEGRKVDYLVLDYNEEEVLDKCFGVSARENSIVLSCDLPQNGGIGVIEYHVDDMLTFKLHKHFNACFEYAI